jgi:hypothetical protein
MIQEMLETGIIQPSQNYFSSPMVMVTKRDGSWRMCLNHRHNNKMTIKDKFHISVIDELYGVKLFTKLDMDLRLGYHQTKMRHEDI